VDLDCRSLLKNKRPLTFNVEQRRNLAFIDREVKSSYNSKGVRYIPNFVLLIVPAVEQLTTGPTKVMN